VAFDLWREARLLAAAAQFLTRLPVPSVVFEPDWLPRSAKYFPLVGLAVGCLAAAMLWAAGQIWPQPIPAILAVAATILLTGALHEDGLADAADSLGGRTRERRLAIMKDSGIGVFGALALALALLLRVAALATMPLGLAAAALVAAGAGGRWMPVAVMASTRYAGDTAASRVIRPDGGPRAREAAIALIPAAAVMLLLAPGQAFAGLLLGGGLAGIVTWRLCRALAGHTGDVLGAGIVLFEVGFLLGVAAGT
jgi:adenosylcobinamide-GDP ribazoletransferase